MFSSLSVRNLGLCRSVKRPGVTLTPARIEEAAENAPDPCQRPSKPTGHPIYINSYMVSSISICSLYQSMSISFYI